MTMPNSGKPEFGWRIPERRQLSSADLLQAVLEARTVADIKLRSTSHRSDLRRIERADHPRRRAQYQRMFGKLFSFGDHRAGADDAAAADPRAVHHDRSHADQRPLLDGAAVQDDVVADGAVLPDG